MRSEVLRPKISYYKLALLLYATVRMQVHDIVMYEKAWKY